MFVLACIYIYTDVYCFLAAEVGKVSAEVVEVMQPRLEDALLRDRTICCA
jgi:hypothetical protein